MIDIDRNLFENVFSSPEQLGFKYYRLNSPTISHWHDQIEVVWVKSGTLNVSINNDTIALEKDSLLLIPVGSTHSYSLDTPCVHHVFLADKNIFKDSSLYNLYVHPFFSHNIRFITTTSNECPAAFDIFTRLENEYYDKKDDYTHITTELLTLFFIYLHRSCPPRENKFEKNFDKYKEAVIYITAHYNEHITLSDITRILHFSPQHFCRLFKSYSGVSFNQYLTVFRLKKANALLIKTNKSIDTIAHEVGFNDAGYFIRVYKKYYKTTPAKARKVT